MPKIILTTLFLASLMASAHAAETNVNQSHTSFDVDEVTIKKGDTVIFNNHDDVTHNIQVVNSDGDADDKGLQKPGQSIKETFSQAGSYKVRCAIHPKMKLKVEVK